MIANPIAEAQRNPAAVRDRVALLKRRARHGAAFPQTPRARRGGNIGPRVRIQDLQTDPTTGMISRRRIRDSYSETAVKSQEFGAVVTRHDIHATYSFAWYHRTSYEEKRPWFTPFNNNPRQGPQYCWEQMMKAST